MTAPNAAGPIRSGLTATRIGTWRSAWAGTTAWALTWPA
jgi:hypothetical protein